MQHQNAVLRDIAQAATSVYNLPTPLALKLINLSENATYEVTAADGRQWALRVHRQGYHTKAAIQSELAWMMALRNAGVVTTPKPVAGRDGEIIQSVKHPMLDETRHIVLTEWESGVEPSIADDLKGPFEVLGECAARMHLLARSWKRPDFFQRFTWDFESSLGDEAPHWGRWRNGVGVDAHKQQLFQRTVSVIGQRLQDYGKSAERFGLVHGDLRLANLLIDHSDVKVIDFDDCGFSWFMYDAATPVSFYEHEPQVPDLIEAWKTGYRKISILTKSDEAEIPTFVMLRRLLLVAWIGSHSETDLAKSMGIAYTEGTAGLCENYLKQFG